MAISDESSRREISGVKTISQVLEVGLDLLLQKELAQQRQTAILLGWSPGEYLILDGPKSFVMSGHLAKQNRVLVKFLHLGRYYAFAVGVRNIVRDPVLVMLDWPERMERVGLSRERRAVLDLEVGLALRMVNLNFKPSVAAVLHDLSLGGCQLRLDWTQDREFDFSKERVTRIEVLPDGHTRPFHLLCQIRNTSQSAGQLVLGVSFEPDQDETLQRLCLIHAPQLVVEAPQPELEPEPEEAPVPRRRSVLLNQPKVVTNVTTADPLGAGSRQSAGHEEGADPEGKLSLEEMTTDRAARLLGVAGLRGPAPAVLRCRRMVCELVNKVGEEVFKERREVFLNHIRRIAGLVVVEED